MLVVDGQLVSLPGVLLLGAAVGALSGLFGLGGTFLLVPLLTVVFGVPATVAAGTGLCQMLGTALSSLLRKRRLGHGEPRFDLLMLAGSVLGVDAGTRALVAVAAIGTIEIGGRTIASAKLVIGATYFVVLLAVGVLFWVQGAAKSGSAPLARIRIGPTLELPAAGLRVSVIVVAYTGVLLGFLSGLLGIGGGVVLLPILIYGFGFPIRQAAGTGIIVLLCSAAYGTFIQALRGHVHLGLAIALLLSATPMAQLGALATHRIAPGRLRRMFAVVVLVTAGALAWDILRRILPVTG